MNFWRISASISVTITYIWTEFGTEHKYHTISTPEWPNLHKLKIQDGGCCLSIIPDWIKIPTPNFTKRCITAIRRWPRDKSRNRKLIRVTSSNERLKHKCHCGGLHCLKYLSWRMNPMFYTHSIVLISCLLTKNVKKTVVYTRVNGTWHI